jgi:hypothetical protein
MTSVAGDGLALDGQGDGVASAQAERRNSALHAAPLHFV